MYNSILGEFELFADILTDLMVQIVKRAFFELPPILDLARDLELNMLSMDKVRLEESFRLLPHATRCGQ